jgi:hypothetical protein
MSNVTVAVLASRGAMETLLIFRPSAKAEAASRNRALAVSLRELVVVFFIFFSVGLIATDCCDFNRPQPI